MKRTLPIDDNSNINSSKKHKKEQCSDEIVIKFEYGYIETTEKGEILSKDIDEKITWITTRDTIEKLFHTNSIIYKKIFSVKQNSNSAMIVDNHTDKNGIRDPYNIINNNNNDDDDDDDDDDNNNNHDILSSLEDERFNFNVCKNENRIEELHSLLEILDDDEIKEKYYNLNGESRVRLIILADYFGVKLDSKENYVWTKK